MIKQLNKYLFSDKLILRIISTFLFGIIVMLLVTTISYYVLPEGILKNKNPLMNWKLSYELIPDVTRFSIYNLITVFLIIFANLIAQAKTTNDKLVPVGIYVLIPLFIIYGLYLGTWSFSEGGAGIPLMARIIRLCDLRNRAGLWEMFGRTLVMAATTNIYLVKTVNKETTTRKFRDISLTNNETTALIIGILFIFIAAYIEVKSIYSL